MPTFNITTLGCKVNQYESEAIAQNLTKAGWTAATGQSPDLILINTCTVTARAARQSLQAVRRAVRLYPGALVVATGCDAQIEPERLAAVKGVSLVVGHKDKQRVPELVASLPAKGTFQAAVVTCPVNRPLPFAPLGETVSGGRTRPYLKIQDGCNAFCTYCIVPYTRGPSRSMPVNEVLTHIRDLDRAGCHEVVLTGIHLGRYGRDLFPRESLAGLLTRIDAVQAIGRVRLSSIEPLEFNADLMAALAASPRVCHHFHIPLQSGDDRILRRMARPYGSAEIRRLVAELVRIRPRAAIGMDVLVGFPGESQAAFEATCALITDLPLAYLHVFPFSPRAGTPAAAMADQVPAPVIRERCALLRRIGRKKREAFYRRFVGHCITGPVEARRDPASGLLKTVSDNYLPVLFEGPDRLMNTLVRIKIHALSAAGRLEGRCLD